MRPCMVHCAWVQEPGAAAMHSYPESTAGKLLILVVMCIRDDGLQARPPKQDAAKAIYLYSQASVSDDTAPKAALVI